MSHLTGQDNRQTGLWLWGKVDRHAQARHRALIGLWHSHLERERSNLHYIARLDRGRSPGQQLLAIEKGSIARVQIPDQPPVPTHVELGVMTRDHGFIQDDIVILAPSQLDYGLVDGQLVLSAPDDLNA